MAIRNAIKRTYRYYTLQRQKQRALKVIKRYKSPDMKKFTKMASGLGVMNKEQQDLLMATHILDKDINIVKALDETANPRVRQDFILNYWLDKHWAGWKGNMSERNKKEEWARERLNQGYKKNKDWASDMLAPEFNIDNMYYG